MRIEPQSVTTFAGGRVVFRLFTDRGEAIDPARIGNVRVELYIPGDERRLCLITPASGGASTVTATVPEVTGVHEASILLEGDGVSQSAPITINVRSLGGMPMEVSVGSYTQAFPGQSLTASVYDPMGTHVETMPVEGDFVTIEQGSEWIGGLYRIVIRNGGGRDLGIDEVLVEKTSYASAPTFWSLTEEARITLEYLKYDLMGDPEPVGEGALLTLEQYASHWVQVVYDINFAIQENRRAERPPLSWYPVVLKGTTIRAFDYLANRAVTVPRFTGVPTMMRDESHLQGAWEQRSANLKREYEREKYMVRRFHMPGISATVDPFFSLTERGGSSGGIGVSSRMGRPAWFPGFSGGGYGY